MLDREFPLPEFKRGLMFPAGQAIGFPRTGSFRLADLVGIDIFAHVAANFPRGVTESGFSAILDEMLKRGWLGDKSGQGFYKKVKGGEGKQDERMALDWKTLQYDNRNREIATSWSDGVIANPRADMSVTNTITVTGPESVCITRCGTCCPRNLQLLA